MCNLLSNCVLLARKLTGAAGLVLRLHALVLAVPRLLQGLLVLLLPLWGLLVGLLRGGDHHAVPRGYLCGQVCNNKTLKVSKC